MRSQTYLKNVVLCFFYVGMLSACVVSPLKYANDRAAEAEANSKLVPIEVPVDATFDAVKAMKSFERGRSSIQGVLFNKVNKFGVHKDSWLAPEVFTRNIEMYLLPDSEYVQRYKVLKEQNANEVKSWSGRGAGPQAKTFVMSPEAKLLRRVSKTDQYGRFSFTGLKPGRYYLFTRVDLSSYYFENVPTGKSAVTGIGYGTYRTDIYEKKEREVVNQLEYDKMVEIGSDGAVVEIEAKLIPRVN